MTVWSGCCLWGGEGMVESQQRLLVFAPTRRAASETFVRANLAGLPFVVTAYFGDECPLSKPARLAYGFSVIISKACTRMGWLRLAEWPAALVALLLIRRHRPDVVLAEFGFHAVRVMQAKMITDDKRIRYLGGPHASDHYPIIALLEWDAGGGDARAEL